MSLNLEIVQCLERPTEHLGRYRDCMRAIRETREMAREKRAAGELDPKTAKGARLFVAFKIAEARFHRFATEHFLIVDSEGIGLISYDPIKEEFVRTISLDESVYGMQFQRAADLNAAGGGRLAGMMINLVTGEAVDVEVDPAELGLGEGSVEMPPRKGPEA